MCTASDVSEERQQCLIERLPTQRRKHIDMKVHHGTVSFRPLKPRASWAMRADVTSPAGKKVTATGENLHSEEEDRPCTLHYYHKQTTANSMRNTMPVHARQTEGSWDEWGLGMPTTCPRAPLIRVAIILA
jgi:hypothetical protein